MLKKFIGYFQWDYSRVKSAFYENKISIPDWMVLIYYIAVLPLGLLMMVPVGIYMKIQLYRLKREMKRFGA